MSVSILLRTAALLLCALISLSSPLSAGIQQTDRTSRMLAISSTTPLTLRATVGDITVIGRNQPGVTVEITRHAPTPGQLTSIAIAVETGKGHASVSALQPAGDTDAARRGSILVHVPFNQVFGQVELFEGTISLTNLRGGVSAHVEHGSIEAVSLAGRIRLETGIGDVRLHDAELTDGIRLRAFNGNVTLGFPSRPLDARILALSMDGAIQSDLPLTLKTAFGPRFGELTLGRGSPVVSIDVVHGNIRIGSRQP